MATLEKKKAKDAQPPVSPVDYTPEHIAVSFLVKQFLQLPPESLRDIVSLMEAWTNPDTPVEDHSGIFETIREILFPELIGGICPVHASTIEPSPPKLRLHSEYLGGTIKKKRTEKGLTQAQLAEKSGLQQSHISRLEAGRYSPSWKTLGKIAEALGIEIGDLDPSN